MFGSTSTPTMIGWTDDESRMYLIHSHLIYRIFSTGSCPTRLNHVQQIASSRGDEGLDLQVYRLIVKLYIESKLGPPDI